MSSYPDNTDKITSAEIKNVLLYIKKEVSNMNWCIEIHQNAHNNMSDVHH